MTKKELSRFMVESINEITRTTHGAINRTIDEIILGKHSELTHLEIVQLVRWRVLELDK